MQYREAVLSVIAFWEKHSIDSEHGGYFTCLDAKGQVFDSDKARRFFSLFLFLSISLRDCLEVF